MLSTIFAKVGRGEPLTPTELEEFTRAGDRFSILDSVVNQYIAPGTTEINLPLPFEQMWSKYIEQDTASLDIPISADFNHLLLMGQNRVNGSGGQTYVYLFGEFNGDTGNNYSDQLLFSSNATVTALQVLSTNHFYFNYASADGSSANYAGSFFTFIPHYRSAYYKNVLTLNTVGSANASSTGNALWSNVWRDTSPISSIRVYPDGTYPNAKIEAGSLVSVYGIR